MSDPYLTVTSSHGTLAFNGVASNGAGVEAQPGATGLGLPPVEATFNAGAGDGATYVGRRISSRTMDIPVTVLAENRADLRAQMRNLAKIVTGEDIILRWIEPEVSTHRLKVQLVGGGDYVYGTDTEGSYYARTTFTFQSEDPFWEDEEAQHLTLTASEPEISFTLDNPGTATAEPVWEVVGPTDGFSLIRGEDELSYGQRLLPHERIRVNTKTGTVIDGTGNNRYAGLMPAPDFFRLDPGKNVVTLRTKKYNLSTSVQRRNHVINPELAVDLTGWGSWRFYDAEDPAFEGGPWERAKNGDDWGIYFDGEYHDTPWDAGATVVVNGLEVGQDYVLSVDQIAEFSGFMQVIFLAGANDQHVSSRVVTLKATPERARVTYPIGPAVTDRLSVTFFPSRSDSNAWGGDQFPLWLSKVYIGKSGDYFSGATPEANGYRFEWTGTPHASQSVARYIDTGDMKASLSVDYNPREWLVI